MKVLKTKNQGFTIIEVVLVLAIAGLIFLMVFIALPALQRNQRDTQRKNDLNRFISAVKQYQANNKGRLPSEILDTSITRLIYLPETNFGKNYLMTDKGEFKNPEGIAGGAYHVWNRRYSQPGSKVPNDYPFYHDFLAAVGMKCDGEDIQSTSGSNRVAVRVKLEGGGVYCQDV